MEKTIEESANSMMTILIDFIANNCRVYCYS